VTAPRDELRDPGRAQEVASLTLAAVPAAVGRARQFARFALNARGLAGLAADTELVVSELVTNAVQVTAAAGPPGTADGAREPEATVRVRVLAYRTGVLIEVWDHGPGAPAHQDAVPGSESGRGLTIVTALCRDWGCHRTADGDKVVWASLVRPVQPLTPAGLPRRTRDHAATAMPGTGLVRDPALLRRVHRALRNL
jgi:anti-sigma regulatory factor (Ser/Thr protein kinase)